MLEMLERAPQSLLLGLDKRLVLAALLRTVAAQWPDPAPWLPHAAVSGPVVALPQPRYRGPRSLLSGVWGLEPAPANKHSFEAKLLTKWAAVPYTASYTN